MSRFFSVVAIALLTMSCDTLAHDTNDNATGDVVVEVNVDSLLDVMAVEYEELCRERREAYAETDSARRKTLLEENDARCLEFEDSLKVIKTLRK